MKLAKYPHSPRCYVGFGSALRQLVQHWAGFFHLGIVHSSACFRSLACSGVRLITDYHKSTKLKGLLSMLEDQAEFAAIQLGV